MADKETKQISVKVTSAIVWRGKVRSKGTELTLDERDAKPLLERGKVEVARAAPAEPKKSTAAAKAKAKTADPKAGAKTGAGDGGSGGSGA